MVNRELYLRRVRNLIDKDIIKIITGIRRSGKTYMLNLIVDELKDRGIQEENIFLISFETAKYNKIENDDQLTNIVTSLTKNIKGRKYLLFDDIQNVKDWERSVNSFRVDIDCDIYITGSNSELLDGKLATLLSGRYMTIKMYPFSFNEIIQYNKEQGEDVTSTKEIELFNEYLNFGGLPFTMKLNEKEDKMNYISDVYNSIVLKEMINQYNIRNIDMLERLLRYMIENIGCLFSANNISKYMKNEERKLSVETITNYLKYFTNSFLLKKVSRENVVGKKVLTTNKKYYLTDIGFYKLFVEEPDIEMVLENIVYNELIRRGYRVTIGKFKNLEIDFICRKNNERKYIQVSQTVIDENTLEREFKPLMKMRNHYPKYVLTMDTWNYSKNGIKHMHIMEFLKDETI